MCDNVWQCVCELYVLNASAYVSMNRDPGEYVPWNQSCVRIINECLHAAWQVASTIEDRIKLFDH